MGATNSFESEVLRHILLNEDIPNIGDAGGLLKSVVDGNVYICLLSTDPGEAGDITNEATFGGYARVAVPRGVTGWTEADGVARNFANIDFPQCTEGSEDLTHFGFCKTLAGDDMFYHGSLPAPALVAIETELRFEPNYLAVNLN